MESGILLNFMSKRFDLLFSHLIFLLHLNWWFLIENRFLLLLFFLFIEHFILSLRVISRFIFLINSLLLFYYYYGRCILIRFKDRFNRDHDINILIFILPVSFNKLSHQGKWHHFLYLLLRQSISIRKKSHKKILKIVSSSSFFSVFFCTNGSFTWCSRKRNFKSIRGLRVEVHVSIHSF